MSSHGRVRTKTGLTSWGTDAHGYRSVGGPAGRRYLVHRLVARAFLGPPPTSEHSDVNHKDGVANNNHKDNLQYVTRSENILHSYSTNANRRNAGAALSKAIWGRRRCAEQWTWYCSQAAAAQELNLNPRGVAYCCAGRYTHTGGHEFRLAEATIPALLPGEHWSAALDPKTGTVLSTWQVSSHGRVRTSRGLLRWGSSTPAGYQTCRVTANGSCHVFLVHRLVARAFLGSCPISGSWQVNHKDGNRKNNHVENLEYVTPSGNVKHSYDTNVTRKKAGELQAKPVLAQRHGAGGWTQYASMGEASRSLGIQRSGISRCCHGKQAFAGVHTFRFAHKELAHALPGEEWCDVVFDT